MRPLDKVLIAGFIALIVIKNSDTSTPKPVDPAVKGMRVLWIVESRDKVPQYITNQTAAKDVRDYLNTHCASENGQPGYRVYDPNTDVSHAPEIWKSMLNAERKSVPWLYIANGRKVSSGVPPKDIPSLMTLLKTYGGK